MHDLTTGSVPRHLVRLAAPIAAGMVFQTLYYLVDLYFVSRLGGTAVAGVSAGGNVQLIIMALTQVLGVGTMALISHAVGRKDIEDANLVFNQSLLLATLCAASTLAGGYALSGLYLRTVSANAETVEAGTRYLFWYLPGLALQFALVSMGSALRGTGIAKPTMVVQMLTVILNVVLAPVLIAGWFTHAPMGVAGAGLASSIAIGVGVLLLWLYFVRLEHVVGFDAQLFRARLGVWIRILRIGVPTGGEFALMFVFTGVIFWVIRDFGAVAQAGFGIGSRVMQAIFVPALAVAFAAAPLAGQNVGARRRDRVVETFQSAAILGGAVMLLLTFTCQWRPEWFVEGFTNDPAVIAIGAQYLRFISLNFVASGLIFTCSAMFQALGNTVPSLASSATRLVTFALPAVWLSTRPGFEMRQLWMLSVATVTLQAAVSLWLLRRELRVKLVRAPVAMAA